MSDVKLEQVPIRAIFLNFRATNGGLCSVSPAAIAAVFQCHQGDDLMDKWCVCLGDMAHYPTYLYTDDRRVAEYLAAPEKFSPGDGFVTVSDLEPYSLWAEDEFHNVTHEKSELDQYLERLAIILGVPGEADKEKLLNIALKGFRPASAKE